MIDEHFICKLFKEHRFENVVLIVNFRKFRCITWKVNIDFLLVYFWSILKSNWVYSGLFIACKIIGFY